MLYFQVQRVGLRRIFAKPVSQSGEVTLGSGRIVVRIMAFGIFGFHFEFDVYIAGHQIRRNTR